MTPIALLYEMPSNPNGKNLSDEKKGFAPLINNF
jgi:hypothetical protein